MYSVVLFKGCGTDSTVPGSLGSSKDSRWCNRVMRNYVKAQFTLIISDMLCIYIYYEMISRFLFLECLLFRNVRVSTNTQLVPHKKPWLCTQRSVSDRATQHSQPVTGHREWREMGLSLLVSLPWQCIFMNLWGRSFSRSTEGKAVKFKYQLFFVDDSLYR